MYRSLAIFATLNLFSILSLGSPNELTSKSGNHFKKVVWIVFENENFSTVLKQPDFAKYAKKGALLNQMIAAVHPSQGNYIAMTAGSTLGVKSDSDVDLNANHVGDLLEAKGMNWRVYAEAYPGNCFTGTSSGTYARKHVPFMSFTNVTKDPVRCAHIENEKRFFADYQSSNLPEFSMYIPDMNNDGHNTGADFAGKWLTKTFDSLLSNPGSTRSRFIYSNF